MTSLFDTMKQTNMIIETEIDYLKSVSVFSVGAIYYRGSNLEGSNYTRIQYRISHILLQQLTVFKST